MTDAFTRASASSIASFAVATVICVPDAPGAKVADEGQAPSSTLPACVTCTVTVSSAVTAPVRVSTNAAAVPSVTGVETAAMEIVGSAAGVSLVACVSATEAARLPAVSCTGVASVAVGMV